MYNTIIFDLDGTLSQSAEGITKSVQYMLEKFGIIETDLKKLECFIGPPITNSLKDLYGFDDEKAWQGVMYYRERFEKKGIYENSPYEGIEEMLKCLKESGKKLAIATSKPQPQTDVIINRYGFNKYLDLVVGPDPDSKSTTKSDVVRMVINRLGCDKETTVMVGDKHHDIVGAKDNNIKSIGVLYGYGSRQELEEYGADTIVATVEELTDLLLG
ncbi:MAG: HAD hydrolase-like protein [Eubacteriales bacterium]|nr:HAD hydrolase-like protein [Eubacteriales bacterium]